MYWPEDWVWIFQHAIGTGTRRKWRPLNLNFEPKFSEFKKFKSWRENIWIRRHFRNQSHFKLDLTSRNSLWNELDSQLELLNRAPCFPLITSRFFQNKETRKVSSYFFKWQSSASRLHVSGNTLMMMLLVWLFQLVARTRLTIRKLKYFSPEAHQLMETHISLTLRPYWWKYFISLPFNSSRIFSIKLLEQKFF